MAEAKKYYLTNRKEDKMLIIKLQGSDKVIQTFKTKAEAEARLKVLAKNQNASVAIQKKDGKFQKKH